MAKKEEKTLEADQTSAQPGQVITPGGVSPESEESVSTPEPTPAPVTIPDHEDTPKAVEESPFLPNDELEPPTRPTTDDQSAISWTASEFVSHHKSAGWYGSLAAVTALVAAAIYLLTRDSLSTIVVVVVGVIFGISAARQPKQQEYKLDSGGVSVGQKYYSYQSFRSFSLVPEGAFSSIIFMPLHRFAPLTSIYFAPEDEDRIMDMLSDRLPFEEHKHDAIDRLMQRIRF